MTDVGFFSVTFSLIFSMRDLLKKGLHLSHLSHHCNRRVSALPSIGDKLRPRNEHNDYSQYLDYPSNMPLLNTIPPIHCKQDKRIMGPALNRASQPTARAQKV